MSKEMQTNKVSKNVVPTRVEDMVDALKPQKRMRKPGQQIQLGQMAQSAQQT